MATVATGDVRRGSACAEVDNNATRDEARLDADACATSFKCMTECLLRLSRLLYLLSHLLHLKGLSATHVAVSGNVSVVSTVGVATIVDVCGEVSCEV